MTRAEIKELLEKQLQLLSEASENNKNDVKALCALTTALGVLLNCHVLFNPVSKE